jgi:hypothetical protein
MEHVAWRPDRERVTERRPCPAAPAALELRFVLLLLAAQVWLPKAGVVSVAIAGFLLLGAPWMRGWRPGAGSAVLATGLLAWAWLTPLPRSPSGFQYSHWFVLAGLAIFLAWTSWVRQLRWIAPARLAPWAVEALLLASVLLMVVLTPEVRAGAAGDGTVGLFNERGTAGYYVASLACLLVALRPGWRSWGVFAAAAVFALLVLHSGRALAFFAASLVLVLRRAGVAGKLVALAAVAVALLLLARTPFLDEQALKLALLLSGEGGVGRYAAAALLADSSPRELLLGHGFGSYLAFRAYLLPMPLDVVYDYPGSVWLELAFEVGLVATGAIVLAVARFVFGRIDLLAIVAVLLLGAFGVKHDVQMLTGLLCAQVMARTLEARQGAPRRRSWSDFFLGTAMPAAARRAE